MIKTISYEMGAKPNKHTLAPNEYFYNAKDGILYTIGKFGEVIEISSLTTGGGGGATGGGTASGIPFGSIVPIASNLAGSHTVPASGVVDSSGFMLCDGSAIPSGKVVSGILPDLTNGRFLRGSTSAGSLGGSDSFTLAVANLPTHNHTMDSVGEHTHTANHNHDASSNTAGNHRHYSTTYASTADDSSRPGQTSRTDNAGTHYTSYAGDHSHTITVNTKAVTTSNNGDHSHTINNTGSGTAKAHIPKYVNVQYIIKVA